MKKILVFCLGIFATASFAQNLPADRPGQTLNASTLQAGLWQVQTGFVSGGFVDSDNGKAFDSWGFPLDIRYGITDRFEFMANGTANFAGSQGTGAGIEYGLLSYAGYFRFNLFDATNFGSMALLAGYQHQSYEGGIASANNFVAKVLYRLPLGEKFQIATNLGYSNSNVNKLDYTKVDGGFFDYTLAFSYLVGEKFGLFLETFGSQGNINSAWIDAGVFWLPNPSVQWDFTFANGGSSGFTNYSATVGVCFQMGQAR